MNLKRRCLYFIGMYTLGTLFISCNFNDINPDQKPHNDRGAVYYSKDVKKFSSCNELDGFILDLQRQYQNDSIGSVPLSSPAESHSSLHYENQESSVDEGDFVQISQNRLYTFSNSSLKVIDLRTDQLIATIELPEVQSGKLFLNKNRIHIVGSSQDQLNTIYVKIDLESLHVLTKKTLVGVLSQARWWEDQLIILTQENNYFLLKGSTSVGTVLRPDCKETYFPQIINQSFYLNHVFQFNDNKMNSFSFMGNSEVLYMKNNQLYLFDNSNWEQSSFLKKIVLNSEGVSEIQIAEFQGVLKDRWSIKEFGEGTETSLLIAVSQNEIQGFIENQQVMKNQFLVYANREGQLTLVSKSEEFGHGEDIRSVRILDKEAYVVTFKKTDPLFVFDISNLHQIHIKSELKIPGFSAYLKPISKRFLLGVGFGSVDRGAWAWFSGVQISLFDIENPYMPFRSDVLNLGVRGSFTDVTTDSHALYFDEKSQIIAMPLAQWSYDRFSQTEEEQGGYGNILDFAGASFYQIQNDKLIELKRMTHEKYRKHLCADERLRLYFWSDEKQSCDIQRVLKYNNSYYLISRFALTKHAIENYELLSEIVF